jgi:hypothetical protein
MSVRTGTSARRHIEVILSRRRTKEQAAVSGRGHSAKEQAAVEGKATVKGNRR